MCPWYHLLSLQSRLNLVMIPTGTQRREDFKKHRLDSIRSRQRLKPASIPPQWLVLSRFGIVCSVAGIPVIQSSSTSSLAFIAVCHRSKTDAERESPKPFQVICRHSFQSNLSFSDIGTQRDQLLSASPLGLQSLPIRTQSACQIG